MHPHVLKGIDLNTKVGLVSETSSNLDVPWVSPY